MTVQLSLGEISVDGVFKDIKNVHLSVYPPTGRVRISAPERMKLDAIRIFAISKTRLDKTGNRQSSKSKSVRFPANT